jgi:hypothetical protein
MLPNKIKTLVSDLRERTEKGLVKWHYDDDASSVVTDQKAFTFSVSYRFDEVEEVGRFNIKHFDKKSRKEYYFSTSQPYSDYELVRSLFDSAQSSDLDVDLDF